jgi:hypothetical protein
MSGQASGFKCLQPILGRGVYTQEGHAVSILLLKPIHDGLRYYSGRSTRREEIDKREAFGIELEQRIQRCVVWSAGTSGKEQAQ